MRTVLRLASENFRSGSGESGAPFSKPSNGHSRKSTILVVEDDVLIRMSVGEFLRHANYRVLEASNADEARAILESREPVELVFSDVSMPGKMNGFELAQWIRKQYPDVGVLLTSGVENLGDTPGYGREHGTVLCKPYALDMVLTYVKRLLLA